MNHSDTIVIGAGAAGLTAAIFAAAGGKSVVLLERTPQAGRKILMSGGTRCNVLPVRASIDDFVTDSSRNRLRNIFKSWSVDRCRRWFEDEIGLELECEASSNKWFPKSNSARDVRDRLLRHAESIGVRVCYRASVASMQRQNQLWTIKTTNGEQFQAPVVIMAAGGKSIPSTGTDGTGYTIAEALGHTLIPPYPALTPLTGPHPGSAAKTSTKRDKRARSRPANDSAHSLAGVSLDVQLDAWNPKHQPFKTSRSGFLFTHQGYSGPSVLDLSHVVVKALQAGSPGDDDASLRVNWTGKSAGWWQSQLEGNLETTALLRRHLPRRLADNLLADIGLAGRKTAELSGKDRNRLVGSLTSCRLTPTGHSGFEKAEVTGGGVSLDDINPATMESRIAPGLYLCGEILDVFGRIGGFNFYWAWVTGRLAGMNQ
ncbi:aminoacetone oxidase family FAD-binding enzyme [Balneolales bacterium ANBcel1]|nr:aminoacetone oxidase family FAD-binding enzyme [Balneolales bacterium ANBcel1]